MQGLLARFWGPGKGGPPLTAVECHFCRRRQEVHAHQRERFFCEACGQYNGFGEDGDYNVARPELFMPELNPVSHAVPGEFRVRHAVSLCPRCESRQQEWLARGREAEQEAPLCPDCAFLVHEKLRDVRAAVKLGYLGRTIATTRQSLASIHPLAQSVWIRLLMFACMLASETALAACALSDVVPQLWFFSSELLAVAFAVLAIGFNRMLKAADAGDWDARYSDVASVGLMVTVVCLGPAQGVRVGAVVVALGLIAVAVLVRLVQALLDWRHRRTIQKPFEHLSQEPQKPRVSEKPAKGSEEDEEEEDPFALGLANKGWSNRKAAFVYQPGEREPAEIARPPSEEELAVEALFQRVALSDGKGGASAPPLVAEMSRVWKSAPRTTAGMAALAAGCRLFFWGRAWSIFLYVLFLGLAGVAVYWEPVEHRHVVLAALFGLAALAIFPWGEAFWLLAGNVEVVILLALAGAVVMMRNNKTA